jgi:MerR family transcriptional regulator, light-induced transcriptional regulator
MYTVGRAAKLTGISPDTLRMWQRRYAVVEPTRSKGGYRLYDDPALRRLAAMKSLVDAGWGPGEAARRVVADEARGVDIVPVPAATVRGDTAALARVGRDFDGSNLDAVLDDGFALGSFEQVVDSWLMPALAQLGAAWPDGSVSVAGEHFVSAAVARRLAASFDAAGRSVSGPCVVVGLARGCRHELGVLAFAAALRRAGLSVVYVGGDLPPEEWVHTIRVREAVAVVLGVPTPEDVPAVRETVQAVSAAHPKVTVYVGGGYQSEVGGAAQPLGHAIGAASLQLAESLAR